MSPEQKAAFIMANAACAFAEIAGMHAVNQSMVASGERPVYGLDEFNAIFAKYLISDERVVAFFKEQ
jgi:hypothetical protein